MKRNIVESYSIEEAFRALNKKPQNKVVEKLNESVDDAIVTLPGDTWGYPEFFADEVEEFGPEITANMANMDDHSVVSVVAYYYNKKLNAADLKIKNIFVLNPKMCDDITEEEAEELLEQIKHDPAYVLSGFGFQLANNDYIYTDENHNVGAVYVKCRDYNSMVKYIKGEIELDRAPFGDAKDIIEESTKKVVEAASDDSDFTTIAEIVPFADFISGKTAIYFLKDFAGYTAELYIGVYNGAIYSVDLYNETADYICEVSDISSYKDLSRKANFDSDDSLYDEKAVPITEFEYDSLTWGEFIQKYNTSNFEESKSRRVDKKVVESASDAYIMVTQGFKDGYYKCELGRFPDRVDLINTVLYICNVTDFETYQRLKKLPPNAFNKELAAIINKAADDGLFDDYGIAYIKDKRTGKIIAGVDLQDEIIDMINIYADSEAKAAAAIRALKSDYPFTVTF